MNINILNAILNVYCEKYAEFNQVELKHSRKGIYEAFKWEAVKHFQNHWDDTVGDNTYPAMFEEAVAKTGDLIDGGIYPLKTTINSLKNPDYVPSIRKAFTELFAKDSGDLVSRLSKIACFCKEMNDINHECTNSNNWAIEYDTRTALACLNLYAPKDNYFYKYGEFNDFCKLLGIDNVGTGEKFSLKDYYALCEELLSVITQHQKIMELTKSACAKDNSFVDDNNHILVYDVINDIKYFIDTIVPYFEKKITLDQKKIDELKGQKVVPKSLVGSEIEVKKYGTGKIVREGNDSVTAVFANIPEEKSFSMKYLGKGFVVKDEEYLAELKKNLDIDMEIAKLNRDIDNAHLCIGKIETSFMKK